MKAREKTGGLLTTPAGGMTKFSIRQIRVGPYESSVDLVERGDGEGEKKTTNSRKGGNGRIPTGSYSLAGGRRKRKIQR